MLEYIFSYNQHDFVCYSLSFDLSQNLHVSSEAMESQKNSGSSSLETDSRSPRCALPVNTNNVLRPWRRPNNMSVFSLEVRQCLFGCLFVCVVYLYCAGLTWCMSTGEAQYTIYTCLQSSLFLQGLARCCSVAACKKVKQLLETSLECSFLPYLCWMTWNMGLLGFPRISGCRPAPHATLFTKHPVPAERAATRQVTSVCIISELRKPAW